MCSLDDTMTDLMCHAEPFEAWSQRLDSAAAPCPSQGSFPSSPTDAAAPAKPCDEPSRAADAVQGEPLNLEGKGGDAAGHSGMMRLAAGIIKDLAEHRLLFELLEQAPRAGTTHAGEPRRDPTISRFISCNYNILGSLQVTTIDSLRAFQLATASQPCY